MGLWSNGNLFFSFLFFCINLWNDPEVKMNDVGEREGITEHVASLKRQLETGSRAKWSDQRMSRSFKEEWKWLKKLSDGKNIPFQIRHVPRSIFEDI